MELVVKSLEIEPLPKSELNFDFVSQPLLNSNYKATVKQSIINSKKPSVSRMRQRLKFTQFNRVNAIGVALKLSVFVFALSMMF